MTGRAPALGRLTVAWAGLEQQLHRQPGPVCIVWLLDGAKHAETDRLAELLTWTSPPTHVVLVSTCTVYGDQHGRLCAEQTPLQFVTPHARVKATCEQMLADSGLSWCVLRFGALYGSMTGAYVQIESRNGRPRQQRLAW